jgi:glycosyltransferase involved in cell wall biosynthesis
VTERPPTVSVGLAVRNGVGVIERCIGSVVSQDFTDLELVISDNASDDGTRGLLEEYARADRRIRPIANEINIGSHENMNRVLDLARGEFFRWISADDWLEPGCLSACIRALRASPDAIGATTYFTINTVDGLTRYEEYRGEFPTSSDPALRFERMLWFFHAGDAKYDPIYGVYRRDALMRSHRLRASEQTDWLLCAELALMGPIIHVDKRLANRTRTYPVNIDRAAFRRRLDSIRGEQLKSSTQRLHHDLLGLVMAADLTEEQVRRCRRALLRFSIQEMARRGRAQVSQARHRLARRARR